MSKLSDIKMLSIKMAKRDNAIYYVLSKKSNKKPLNVPIHYDSVFDTDTLEITFIGFPHSSIVKTVITEETKPRWDKMESNYARFWKKKARNKNLTFVEYSLENAI